MTDYQNIRAAFRHVTLGLMEWQDPPLMGPRQYAALEGVRHVYRPYDPQGEVEPFDLDASDRECGI